jgi:hypothetical protein
MDYGLILEKPRGLSVKCPKLDFSGIVFLKKTHGPRGGREEGRAGELNGGVAAAREAVEERLTGNGHFGSEGRRRGRDEG